MSGGNGKWQPTRVVDFQRALPTSMRTVEVTTDAGRAFLKAMGNPEGPHPLASEWVATNLARWFDLRTFSFAILPVADWNELPFTDGGRAAPGPAFVTRAEAGHPWGGTATELDLLENPFDLTRLIVFDTWVRNCDRYCRRAGETRHNRDNVFLADVVAVPGRLALIAMDFTHSFTCGAELTQRLANIERIRDRTVYGGFPQFHHFFDLTVAAECQDRMRAVGEATIARIVRSVPREWAVSDEARKAWIAFLIQRAKFLAGWKPWEFCPVADEPMKKD